MTIQPDNWARSEERPFLRRALDWVNSVRADHQWKLTDFLSPREIYLLESVAISQDMVVSTFGGATFAERQRALIMPSDWYPQSDDYHITILSVEPATRRPLSHGSILGSVLGTGLDRRKVGDIFMNGAHSYLAICEDVHHFLTGEWNAVGREPVTLQQVQETAGFEPPNYEQQTISVASLRVDAVIAQTCHWSRQDAQSAVESGRVSLNFTELKRKDASIAVGDLLSVRGFGRISVLDMMGTSKRGRERVGVGVLRSNPSDRS